VTAAREAMGELIQEMESLLCASSVIEQKMVALSELLADTKGKKVYGYLKKPAKKLVDEIVNELAAPPQVAECYEVWNRLRDEVENYYKDTPREWKSLSQQKEFKAIKNMVIREAENIRLGAVTFEGEDMVDETWEEEESAPSFRSLWQMAEVYREAKEVLYDEDAPWTEMENAVQTLEQLWDVGFTVAAHQLGKCWRDGLGVMPDDEKVEAWFRKSAEAGNDFSQYALGKLLQQEKRIQEAVEWYKKASAQRNQYANYRLGKLYLQGGEVPKDVSKAIGYEELMCQHIIPGLGDIPLNELTQPVLQQFYVKLKESGRKKNVERYGPGLSDRTVRNCHALCRTALEKALEEKLVRKNPAVGCKLPPSRPKEMQVLTVEEIQRLLIEGK